MLSVLLVYFDLHKNLEEYLDNIRDKINCEYEIHIVCNEFTKQIVSRYTRFFTVFDKKTFNNLCFDINFWKLAKFNKVLVSNFRYKIQDENITEWMNHDFIGKKRRRVIKECDVDGRLSIRDKNLMISILENNKVEENIFEDIYFQNIINRKLFNNYNYNYKKIFIIHCGNIEIMNEILEKFPQIMENKCLITYYNKDYKNILYDTFKTNYLNIIKVRNKGTDCGPFLLCINYLLNNSKLYNNNTIFIKIHTKSIADWRDKLIKDIVDINFIRTDVPVIMGCDKYTFDNNKLVNSKYVYDIIERNENNNYNLISDYCDIYHKDKVSDKTKTNIFQDLYFNLNFYKNYEPDLDWVIDDEHWRINGVKEFHRISNVNYIKSFSKIYNKFVAGTIFGFNSKFLEIFYKYDLIYEYELLEEGYLKNKKISKMHAWEYFFSLINYINNGSLLTYNNSIHKKTFDKNCLKPQIDKTSLINVPFLSSKSAMFLIIPGENPDSGGYRTLLKYISNVNKTESMDIYFGICWNDSEVLQNVTEEDNLGVPLCNNWRNDITLDEILDRISRYNEIDITKNNYYIGFKCQRGGYEILYANAWQTAEAVYLNKNSAKKIIYYIQDREEIFYPNDINLQKNVLKTYKSEFEYHCITKYLENYFKTVYKLPNVKGFRMSADTSVYFNKKQERENAVAIPYYKDIKPARLPRLVEQCIEKFSNEGYKCYVFPFDYSKGNEKVINIGNQTVTQLNDLYNKCKLGVIFSTSNPSRLGFEMYESGLKVIEYDCEFTKYDMPDDKFFKIKKIEDLNKYDVIN